MLGLLSGYRYALPVIELSLTLPVGTINTAIYLTMVAPIEGYQYIIKAWNDSIATYEREQRELAQAMALKHEQE